jgi:hypothetical protein
MYRARCNREARRAYGISYHEVRKGAKSAGKPLSEVSNDFEMARRASRGVPNGCGGAPAGEQRARLLPHLSDIETSARSVFAVAASLIEYAERHCSEGGFEL